MPWVAIAESGVGFNLLGAEVHLEGSVVVSNGQAVGQEWTLVILEPPHLLRVTAEEYTADPIPGSPASFDWFDHDDLVNTPNTDDSGLSFQPTTFEARADGMGSESIVYLSAMGGSESGISESFRFLVEIWQGVDPPDPPEPPVEPSYNCECEDEYPARRTLAELRNELADRLNFSDEQGAAPPRTLEAMRESLRLRLGYGDQEMTEGFSKLLAEFLRDAQETLYRRFELDRYGEYSLAPFVDPGDVTTIDPQAVFLLALGNAKAHYGKVDAKVYFEQLERYIGDLLLRRPPNLKGVLNSLLRTAQETLYRRYNVLRTERIFRWELVPGVRFYDLDGNDDACERRLDPRKVSWVGIERNGLWSPLVCGIPPNVYSFDQTGFPSRYEIRQCIEIWPAPDAEPAFLRVKGRFELDPFTDDAHKTTIDHELVFLLALANGKAHYKQADGVNYVAQLETMMQNLVAGSHHTRRYIPGGRALPLEPEPVWSTGTWPPV